MQRRYFTGSLISGVIAAAGLSPLPAQEQTARRARLNGKAKEQPAKKLKPAGTQGDEDRILGLLLGGLIGDALGGPIEFLEKKSEETGLTNARLWPDNRKLDTAKQEELAASVPLLGYQTLRPRTAPYGPWREQAVAGTLTDDSRHKIVLLNALRRAQSQKSELTAEHVAHAFLEFSPVYHPSFKTQLKKLNAEGFREYRMAARWMLGERDLQVARPVARLWAGINNCSGQMMLPPLAAAYAGRPEQAYLKAFEVDFIDAPQARDMAASLVAALAVALRRSEPGFTIPQRWQQLFETLASTDPYFVKDVPFAGRPWTKWLQRADEFVAQSQGSPKHLYRLLETEGDPVYWWDAHFTLLVPICMLKLCHMNPMAAMHLTLDFGHDTDSYAQVLGCLIGAVHGQSVFPKAMRDAVRASLKQDYAQNVDEWSRVLAMRTSVEAS